MVTERVTALLEARLRDRDRLQKERMQRFTPLARSWGETEDEVAIIAMLLDDYYQESLNVAPEGPEIDSRPRQPQRGERKPRRRPRGKGRRRGGR